MGKTKKIDVLFLIALTLAISWVTISPAKAQIENITLGPLEIRSAGDSGTNVKIVSIKENSSLLNPIQLTFRVQASLLPYCYSSVGNIGYSIDDGSIFSVNNFINQTIVQTGVADEATVWANVNLPSLSEGYHKVTVYFGRYFEGINQRYEVLAYSAVDFTVDTSSPKISVISPEPKVYNVSDISLNYTINEPVQKVAYSSDGQDNVTITDNTKLSSLTSGMHNITVYAWDTAGNVGASTVNFTIKSPSQNQILPLSEIIIITSLVLIVASTLTIILYRRRKTSASK